MWWCRDAGLPAENATPLIRRTRFFLHFFSYSGRKVPGTSFWIRAIEFANSQRLDRRRQYLLASGGKIVAVQESPGRSSCGGSSRVTTI